MHSITRLYNNFFVILIKEGKEIELLIASKSDKLHVYRSYIHIIYLRIMYSGTVKV